MDEKDYIECVKCSQSVPYGARSCGACTWPLSLDGWKHSTFVVKRVTIDTGCINVKQKDSNLNTLESWASQGHIRIERSQALIEELRGKDRLDKANTIDPHPDVWTLGMGALGIDTTLAGPDMYAPINDILFPTTRILTRNQEYDIEHLRSHVLTGGDVFVTRNPNDFVVRGKKESLAALGIWVFDPPGAVRFLQDLYDWGIVDA